jgi:hypothetical protein
LYTKAANKNTGLATGRKISGNNRKTPREWHNFWGPGLIYFGALSTGRRIDGQASKNLRIQRYLRSLLVDSKQVLSQRRYCVRYFAISLRRGPESETGVAPWMVKVNRAIDNSNCLMWAAPPDRVRDPRTGSGGPPGPIRKLPDPVRGLPDRVPDPN